MFCIDYSITINVAQLKEYWTYWNDRQRDNCTMFCGEVSMCHWTNYLDIVPLALQGIETRLVSKTQILIISSC